MSAAALGDAEALPADPGAYGLVIDLLTPVTVAIARQRPVTLDDGRYLYVGSARGPGGIRARVRRHLKAAKPLRWHVDRLTNTAGVARVLAFPDGNECGLGAGARSWPGAWVPAPGFGASDCRVCPAHLIMVAADMDPEDHVADLVRASGAGSAVIWRAPPVLCWWRPPATPGAPAP